MRQTRSYQQCTATDEAGVRWVGCCGQLRARGGVAHGGPGARAQGGLLWQDHLRGVQAVRSAPGTAGSQGVVPRRPAPREFRSPAVATGYRCHPALCSTGA
jgi:hypothetical protein